MPQDIQDRRVQRTRKLLQDALIELVAEGTARRVALGDDALWLAGAPEHPSGREPLQAGRAARFI